MLERITRELPKLTDAVVRADVKGEHSFDVTKTGAADAARATGREGGRRARARRPRRPSGSRARPARSRASPAPRAPAKGAVASEGDLAIAGYDSLNAGRDQGPACASLSQVELAKVARLRAQEREPHDDPRADLQPPGRRAVARLRRAHGLRDRRRPRRGRRGPRSSRPARTSAPTRTAPASSRPPSARPATCSARLPAPRHTARCRARYGPRVTRDRLTTRFYVVGGAARPAADARLRRAAALGRRAARRLRRRDATRRPGCSTPAAPSG